MDELKFETTEYQLKNISVLILQYRKRYSYEGRLEVLIPFEAEHSMGFLTKSYPPSTQFVLSMAIPMFQLVIRKVKDVI